jgi:hypothetical protein
LLSNNTKIKIHITIIFLLVFYECETWSLIFREECRLRVFENRVLRRIFGPKGDEVTGEWRILHNEELSDLYWSPNTFQLIKSRMRWAGHVARMGIGDAYTGFRWVNLRERGHLEDPSVNGRIMLR